tara:strand:- start:114 stop:590 length:477 start_codon:yes stop_codon:yes gene_type:complete
MKLRNVSKNIRKFDYGELALLIILLTKTINGVIYMNFKQINKPDFLIRGITSLNIVWVWTDISNFNIYPLHVLLFDIFACLFFIYYYFITIIKKTKDSKNYNYAGFVSLLYSMVVFAETIVMADTVTYKVFLISIFSCIMFFVAGLTLCSSKYTSEKE